MNGEDVGTVKKSWVSWLFEYLLSLASNMCKTQRKTYLGNLSSSHKLMLPWFRTLVYSYIVPWTFSEGTWAGLCLYTLLAFFKKNILFCLFWFFLHPFKCFLRPEDPCYYYWSCWNHVSFTNDSSCRRKFRFLIFANGYIQCKDRFLQM